MSEFPTENQFQFPTGSDTYKVSDPYTKILYSAYAAIATSYMQRGGEDKECAIMLNSISTDHPPSNIHV